MRNNCSIATNNKVNKNRVRQVLKRDNAVLTFCDISMKVQ